MSIPDLKICNATLSRIVVLQKLLTILSVISCISSIALITIYTIHSSTLTQKSYVKLRISYVAADRHDLTQKLMAIKGVHSVYHHDTLRVVSIEADEAAESEIFQTIYELDMASIERQNRLLNP